MRSPALAATLFVFTVAGSCTFSAHPPSGVQACSNDDPPQCPAGYACVDNLCYDNGHLPATGGTSGSNDDSAATEPDAATDAPTCTPAALPCRTGSGKRCGDIADSCGGTVKCGACISAETCTNHVCTLACGQVGQPCCVGSRCTDTSSVCSNGQCIACGGVNEACCASDVCAASGAKCAETTSIDAGRSCLPACLATTGTCNQASDQDCALECGPSKIGIKTCSCASSTWKCQACSFPAGGTYACYKLPSPIPVCDANTPPTVGASCSVADCSPCGSATNKGFVDSGNSVRSGFCVCTNSRWNCTLTKDWPCPGNPGC